VLSRFAILLLTASSIAPVGFTYAWVAFWQREKTVAIGALVVGVVACCACISLLHYARTTLESFEFEPQSIEPADTESLGFMLLYLLPLFTDKISDLHWEIWVPIIGVFSIIVATGFGYHFNPLLGIFQWHFYKVTSRDNVTYVLITKKQLRKAAQV
jgi:hypothetical protein